MPMGWKTKNRGKLSSALTIPNTTFEPIVLLFRKMASSQTGSRKTTEDPVLGPARRHMTDDILP